MSRQPAILAAPAFQFPPGFPVDVYKMVKFAAKWEADNGVELCGAVGVARELPERWHIRRGFGTGLLYFSDDTESLLDLMEEGDL